MNRNVKHYGAVRERERERERESNNLEDRCRGNLDFPHLRRNNPNRRGEHCSSMLQRTGYNCVGKILISRSTEKYSNNKTKNYAKIKSTYVGAAFGSPLYEESTQENKENFNRAMPMMDRRPKGAPTKNEDNKLNIVSDCQRQPLQNTGITLIALIITIILLLILAGVTIHFTLGENGILRNAEIAANKYKQAGENEANLLDEIEGYMNGDRNYPPNTPQTKAGERVAMPDGWYSETSATYEVPEVRKVTNTKRTAFVYAISDGENNTIPIPKDFYYVGGNINTGIVISDKSEDEKKYANSSNGDVGKELKGNQFVWIPCSIENYHKIDFEAEDSRWDRTTQDAETFQIKKYGGFYIGRYEAGVSVLDKTTNTFKDSVTFDGSILNGHIVGSTDSHKWGWQNTSYLARSSAMTSLLGSANKANGNIVVQADAIPYYHVDYYTAKEMSKRLYNNKSAVESGLVTGTQWDMMMKYMQDNGVAVKGTGSDWGNCDDIPVDGITGYYTGIDSTGSTDTDGFKNGSSVTTNSTEKTYTLLTTASSEKVKKMNLYDVLGNLWEWTDESAYINSTNNTIYSTADYNTFVLRGGGFGNTSSSYPACFRTYGYALGTSTDVGFRAALYIK